MTGEQAKLAHQLIPFINTFLHPVDKREEKTHARHPISKIMSEAVKLWLTRRSWTYL